MQNSVLAIFLARPITVQRRGIGEKYGFLADSPAFTKGLKKVTNLFQIDLFPHKKVKFAHFSTKQVCNVKKKNFQSLINVKSNFLI